MASVDNATADPTSDEESLEDGMYDGSVLGTKEHWDKAYTREVRVFEETDGAEVGEVWFGEDTLERMCELVAEVTSAEGAREAAGLLSPDQPWRVLDVGCGNATTMVALTQDGFTQILGTDYSPQSVDLSRRVVAAHEERMGKAFPGLLVQEDDVLASSLESDSFELVVDKGTLDAVGLHPTRKELHRRLYLATIRRVLVAGGLFVITSCNSTREEISAEVCAEAAAGLSGKPKGTTGEEGAEGVETEGTTTDGDAEGDGEESLAAEYEALEASWPAGVFEVVDWVKTHPSFEFGGVTGSKVATVAFRWAPSREDP